MIKNHLPNILTCFKQANAKGYRSFDGFRNSILFYWLFVEECELPYTIPIRRTVLLESA